MPIFDKVPESAAPTSAPAKQPFRLHWLSVLSLMLAAYLAGTGSGRESGLREARRECCERWRNGFEMARVCPLQPTAP